MPLGRRLPQFPLPLIRDVGPRERRFVEKMLERKIQTVETSSCGRLFDAVASILGLRHQTTYEGQAAIELEAVASSAPGAYPFALTSDTPFQVDLRPCIEAIAREHQSGTSVPDISARFHRTMACVVRDACLRIREVGWSESGMLERRNIPESSPAPARGGPTTRATV